jgi:hypothetical protein
MMTVTMSPFLRCNSSLPTGKHEIRVQVSSEVDGYRRTVSIQWDFSKDKGKTLDVSIHGHGREMTVSMD